MKCNSNFLFSIFNFLSFLFLASFIQPNYGHTNNKTSGSKNILFYMGVGSYSMRISIWPLIEALTDKGHRVTFVSAYESKDPHPGVVDYVPKKLKEWWDETEPQIDLVQMRKNKMLLFFWFTSPQFGIEVCQKVYEDPEALKWIQSSKFDLVVIDSFMNDCAYGLAYAFQAKTIVLSTSTLFPWFYENFGIPDDSSWAGAGKDPSFALPPREMNFLQRATNAVVPVLWKFIRELWYMPKLEEITKAGLKLDSVPSFIELEKNTSLTFLTTHYSQEFARALPPNVVPIGGLALTGKLKPLPKEIQDFIDRGKNGFIYISFGTLGEFSALDKEIQDAFVQALLKFPQFQFIWKSTKGVGVDLPDNFLVLKWTPQQSLLAHPKIKAFISHAGLGGTNEAIYYGVPFIAFPLFAEQDYNANLVEAKQAGVKLEITTLKAEELENAIKAATETPRMKQTMMKLSKLFKSRPVGPLESALWWTEYVLENDASDLTEFLRPRNVNQAWWEKRQLDVWLFILTVIFITISITLYIVKRLIFSLIRRICQSGTSSRGKKVKQN